MANLNVVAITGRIAKDLEVKKSGSGISVLSFSIATTDMKKKTDFFDVVLFGGVADFISKYANKGALINIKGHLGVNEYTNREGRKIRTTQIVGEAAEIVNNPNQQHGAPNVNNVYETRGANRTQSQEMEVGNGYDSIPDTDNNNAIDITSDDLPF